MPETRGGDARGAPGAVSSEDANIEDVESEKERKR